MILPQPNLLNHEQISYVCVHIGRAQKMPHSGKRGMTSI